MRKGRAAKTVQREPKVADIVLAPYNQLYTERDAAEDRLITTLLLGGEALAASLRAEAAWRETGDFATPEGNDHPAILDDFVGLLAITEQIQAWIGSDARRVELLSELREAFGNGDAL